jgi:hypothetical protein
MAAGINGNFECLASRIETTLTAELYQTKTTHLRFVLNSVVANQAQKAVIVSLGVSGISPSSTRIMGGVLTDNLGNTLPLQSISGFVRCAPDGADCIADDGGEWTQVKNGEMLVVTVTFANEAIERIGRTGSMTLEAVIKGRGGSNTLQGLGVANFPIENGT